MIVTFKKIIKNICFNLSNFIPKQPNLWIFGSWYGLTYNDNSRYLFEYINSIKTNIDVVWISRNKGIVKQLTNRGYVAFYALSLKGIFTTMRAQVAVFSCGYTWDFCSWALGQKTKKIQLWHGAGIKKIKINENPTLYSLVLTSSIAMKKRLANILDIPSEKIVITGLPRNDVFFRKMPVSPIVRHFDQIKKKKSQIFLFLPTLRKKTRFDPIINLQNQADYIDNWMKTNNAHLYIKMHFFHESYQKTSIKKIMKQYKNIHFLSNNQIDSDVQTIFPFVDFLVTDYSSIFTDFLLLDKPVFFTPFDYPEYTEREQLFYYDYNQITPGPKAKSWKDLFRLIKKPEISLHYRAKREKLKTFFHQYNDGKNCQRAYNAIQNYLSLSVEKL